MRMRINIIMRGRTGHVTVIWYDKFPHEHFTSHTMGTQASPLLLTALIALCLAVASRAKNTPIVISESEYLYALVRSHSECTIVQVK